MRRLFGFYLWWFRIEFGSPRWRDGLLLVLVALLDLRRVKGRRGRLGRGVLEFEIIR